MLLSAPCALDGEKPSMTSTRAAVTRQQYDTNVMACPLPVMRRRGQTSRAAREIGIVPDHACNDRPDPPAYLAWVRGHISAGIGVRTCLSWRWCTGNASRTWTPVYVTPTRSWCLRP